MAITSSAMNEGSSAESMLNSTLVAEAWASAELAMLVVDDDGHYIATNRSAEHLTGYTHHELLNLRAGRALAGDEDSTCIYQDLARRHTTQGRKVVRRKDGSTVNCRYLSTRTTVSNLPYLILLLWSTSPAG
jgi:PAS domain S-box-containing protein